MSWHSLNVLLSVQSCPWGNTWIEQLHCIKLLPIRCSFDLESHINLCHHRLWLCGWLTSWQLLVWTPPCSNNTVHAVPRLHGYRKEPSPCLWPKFANMLSGPISPPHTGNSITGLSSIQDGDRNPLSGLGGGGKMVVTINISWLKSLSGNIYGEKTIAFPYPGFFPMLFPC